MAQPWRILVVDDLPMWEETIRIMAKPLGAEVRAAANLSLALREVSRWDPHLVLLDLHMPRDSWVPQKKLLEKYGRTLPTLAFCELVTTTPQLNHIKVILTSVESKGILKRLARQASAHGFCPKGELNFNKLKELLGELEHAPVSTR
jgi:CheY-like chemotaxis protein